MSSQPNRYRDLHRDVQTLGNRASGLGLYAEATSLWSIAAAIKEKGRPADHDASEGEREMRDERGELLHPVTCGWCFRTVDESQLWDIFRGKDRCTDCHRTHERNIAADGGL